MNIPRTAGHLAALKSVRRDEPIIRNRFVECPHCKTRNFKVKKTIDVGRCRMCRDSYKIITIFMKVGADKGSKEKELNQSHGPSLPSRKVPSDSVLFGSNAERHSAFSNLNFAWSSE